MNDSEDFEPPRLSCTGVVVDKSLNEEMRRELRELVQKYGASSGFLLVYFQYDEDDCPGEWRSETVGSQGEAMYAVRQRVLMEDKQV